LVFVFLLVGCSPRIGKTLTNGASKKVTVYYKNDIYDIAIKKSDSVLTFKVYIDAAIKVADITLTRDTVVVKGIVQDLPFIQPSILKNCFIFNFFDDLFFNGLASNASAVYILTDEKLQKKKSILKLNLLCDYNNLFSQIIISKFEKQSDRIRVRQLIVNKDYTVVVDK
jgi:hypothetical protein